MNRRDTRRMSTPTNAKARWCQMDIAVGVRHWVTPRSLAMWQEKLDAIRPPKAKIRTSFRWFPSSDASRTSFPFGRWWFAPDSKPHFLVLISPHPVRSPARPGGGYGHGGTTRDGPGWAPPEAVPDAPAEVRGLAAAAPGRGEHRRGCRPDRCGPLDDHEAADRGQGGRPGRAVVLPPGGPSRQARSGAAGGPGRDRPARGDREGTGRRAHVAAGKRGALGLSCRVPRRVDAATKAGLLELIDGAVAEGWDHRRACRVLGLKESRAWRWRIRRDGDRLADRPGGGRPVHGLLAAEEAEIVALFEEWGEVDRSHRKLAHRGSYLHRVWVSPSSVRRVLAAHGLHLHRPRRIGTSVRRPFPEWV